MTLTRKTLLAVTITAAVAPLFAIGSFAAVPAKISHSYLTKIGAVHVRSQPNNSHGSKILTTLGAPGTAVAVTCTVRTAINGHTHVWYRTVQPVGYVAGRNLALPRHQVTGLPAC